MNLGGDFDRLVRYSLHQRIKAIMQARGWFDTPRSDGGTRFTQQVILLDVPVDARDEQIRPNLVGFNLRTVEWRRTGLGDDERIGWQGFTVDVFAEGDTVGRELRGDILAGLGGMLEGFEVPEFPIQRPGQAQRGVAEVDEDDDEMGAPLFGDRASGFSDHRRYWFTVEGVLQVRPWPLP